MHSRTNPIQPAGLNVVSLGVMVVLVLLASHCVRQYPFNGISPSAHHTQSLSYVQSGGATRSGQHTSDEGSATESIPDFASQPIPDRKQAFVSFILPYVEQENERIATLRQQLERLAQKDKISAGEREWMRSVAEQFKLQKASNLPIMLDRLLKRVDVLPASLVLAQAANESGWGTSRFAQQANNIFGHWCMKPGCGLVPRNRPDEAHYEVEKFSSVEFAVQRYFRNLNTNPAFRALREIRACHRSMGEALSGPVMAGGLLAYSGRGTAYVKSVRNLIFSNDWQQLDGDEFDLSRCDTADATNGSEFEVTMAGE